MGGHPDYEAFCVEVPINDEQAMEDFQEAMDAYHDELTRHFAAVAEKLGISESDAELVVYLRGRSRWDPELEARLVRAFKDGHDIRVLSGEEEEDLARLGY